MNSPYNTDLSKKTKEKKKGFLNQKENHTYEFLLPFGIFVASVPETKEILHALIHPACLLKHKERMDKLELVKLC